MPSGQAPLPRLLRPENLALARVAVLIDAQARDAAAGGLDDVQPLLVGVEADLVGEAEAIGHDPELAVVVAREVAIREIGAQRVHPVLDPRGHRDPDAILRIAQHEVDLADRLAVDAIGEHARLAVARHDLQAIGAEVGDQDVAIAGEGQAVGERAFQIAAGLAAGRLEMLGASLRDDPLLPSGRDSHDAAAGVGGPRAPSGSARMHSGPLQIVADVAERVLSIPKSRIGLAAMASVPRIKSSRSAPMLESEAL